MRERKSAIASVSSRGERFESPLTLYVIVGSYLFFSFLQASESDDTQKRKFAQMEDDARKYTVDDALISMGFGKYQYLILAYAGMGSISEAMEMMLLSFVGPAVQAEWGLSSNQESTITSVIFAGMLIGAYSMGVISDNFGRRKGFLTTAIVTSAAGFFSALAPNYSLLVICRFLVGVGLGGGHVLSSWFLEFIPAPSRGTWVSISSAFWTVGTIMEALLAWIVMPTLGWRWLLILSAIPSSFLLIFYFKTPESPRYLYMRGRTDDALHILERIAIMNRTKLPSGVLVSLHKAGEDTNSQSEDARLLSPTKSDSKTLDIVGSNARQGASVFTLLSPKLLKSTLLLWAVFSGSAFSYYGLVLLTTELSNGKNNCTATHQEAGVADLSYRNIFITSFAEFPGKVIAAVLADRIGRKGSMSSMFFVCCLFLLPLAFDQSEGLVTPLLFGARTCITATSTIVYIYAPEIYPTAVRTTGVGVASSMGRFGGMLCPLVAVSLVHGCHITASIFLFDAVIFVSGVCVILFPLETKGRELSDNVSDLNHEIELA